MADSYCYGVTMKLPLVVTLLAGVVTLMVPVVASGGTMKNKSPESITCLIGAFTPLRLTCVCRGTKL